MPVALIRPSEWAIVGSAFARARSTCPGKLSNPVKRERGNLLASTIRARPAPQPASATSMPRSSFSTT